MSIKLNQFNPIGYTSQTSDGQTYQKSNIGKTVLLAGTLAIDTFGATNKYLKQFTLENVLRNDLKLSIPNKYVKPLNILSIAIDLGVAYGVGQWIDKQINKHRINKLSQNVTK